jgi:DNA-binding NarL/FixJ family response regulator
MEGCALMETPCQYRIIIADDHEIVRAGAKFTLMPHTDFCVEAEASSFSELMSILGSTACDVLILDLNLGDKNGIPAIREISDRFPSLLILVVSMFPEDPYALQAVQAGAAGYLNKKRTSDELLSAVEAILGGKTYLSQEYTETLPYGTPLEKNIKPSIDTLSKREFEVYEMIVSGLSYKEIAEALELSPKTISTYRARILEKLSLHNINQLIHFSLQNSMGSSE